MEYLQNVGAIAGVGIVGTESVPLAAEIMSKDRNPTNGSWWMVQIQPTHRR